MATSTPRPVGPQNLEIVPADLDVPEAPLDFKLAKDRHTLDLCVRLTAHEDVFNADNKIKPQQEWGELAPGHNKHHRNAMGLPLNVDYYPFCPCYKKKEYDDEGNIHRVLGLRDYGCSVAVDLYLRLQIEGFFLFICIFLVSLPALSNNLDRNNRRIECREAVEANPFNTSAWLEGCGYAGKPIRNENISWPTAGYPWLRTCLGACEEYSNATDVIQPAVGQHDEPFVDLADADFCADQPGVFWVQFGVVIVFITYLIRMRRLSRVAALADDASRVTTADFAVQVRGLYGFNERSKPKKVEDLKADLMADLELLGFDVARDIDHIEMGQTCREQLQVQRELRMLKIDMAEAKGRFAYRPSGTCFSKFKKWVFDVSRRLRKWAEAKKLQVSLDQRAAELSVRLAGLREEQKWSTGHAFITFQTEKDRDKFRDMFHRKTVDEMDAIWKLKSLVGWTLPAHVCMSKVEENFLDGKYRVANEGVWMRSAPKVSEVEVVSAPEPSEVLWDNLELDDIHERRWVWIGRFVQSIFILLACGITVGMRVSNASVSNHVGGAGKMGMSVAISLVITICNSVLRAMSVTLTNKEGLDTKTYWSTSLFSKVSKAYLLNSVVIPAAVGLATSLFIQHTPVNQAWYEATGVVQIASTLIVVNTLTYNSLRLFQYLPLIQRVVLSNFVATQEKLTFYFKPPQMMIGTMYSETAATIGLGLIYGPLYPPAYALTAIAMFIAWLTTKFSISFWYKRPPSVNTEMLDAVRYRLSIILALAIIVQGFTAWYAAGGNAGRITLGSTVASPLLWFFYEVAPLKRLRWLKPVTELIASEEASKEADQGPIPLVQIAKPKPASSRKGSNNRSLNEESRARKGGEGVVSWILNGIATIGITNANIEEDLSGLRFENVLETMGYEVEYYKCPIEPRSGAPSSSRSAAMNEEMNQI